LATCASKSRPPSRRDPTSGWPSRIHRAAPATPWPAPFLGFRRKAKFWWSPADTPLILPSSLRALLELRRERGAALAVTTAILSDGSAYGRVVRDGEDNVVAIVEARDSTEAQRRIKEVNAGSYAFDLAALRPLLAQLSPDNAQGEYYLTDVVGLAVAGGLKVAGLQLEDASEMAGVNTRADLALVHRLLNLRTIARLQTGG